MRCRNEESKIECKSRHFTRGAIGCCGPTTFQRRRKRLSRVRRETGGERAFLVKAVELGNIPPAQYDGVLIDEAHDFEPQWLSLAVKMVNPSTKAFMIAYDDMQAIYKGRGRPVWSQLGIEAKGRTRVLKINYRNTAQILAFARHFAAEISARLAWRRTKRIPVLLPEDAGRQGVEPEVRRCVSFDAEAHCIAEWLLGRKKAGYEWPQMAVLYPEHSIGEQFARILAKHGCRSTSRRRIGIASRRNMRPCGY